MLNNRENSYKRWMNKVKKIRMEKIFILSKRSEIDWVSEREREWMTFYQNYLHTFFFNIIFLIAHLCMNVHIKIFFYIQQNRNIHFSCSKKKERTKRWCIVNVKEKVKFLLYIYICAVYCKLIVGWVWGWPEGWKYTFSIFNIYGYSCSIIYAK